LSAIWRRRNRRREEKQASHKEEGQAGRQLGEILGW